MIVRESKHFSLESDTSISTDDSNVDSSVTDSSSTSSRSFEVDNSTSESDDDDHDVTEVQIQIQQCKIFSERLIYPVKFA